MIRFTRIALIALLYLNLVQMVHAQSEQEADPDWARERIMLPPRFAPDMPAGVEELRFPPGWRDPQSENFWSYAIVMWIDESVPSTERLEEITDLYYTGLMSVFGIGQGSDSLPNEVEVDFNQTSKGIFEGKMNLIDGFATKKPIEIKLQVKVKSNTDQTSTLEFRVSLQDHNHNIWQQLQSAIQGISQENELQKLSHLTQGEWRTDITNGSQQRDTWSWGPSRHALTSTTTNSTATSESIFGSFRVVYANPQTNKISVLALSSPELIQTGFVETLDQQNLKFDMTIFYDLEQIEWASQPTRPITSVWAFDNSNSYTNSWILDQGAPVKPGSVAWTYSRNAEITPKPKSAHQSPEIVQHLSNLIPLMNSVWETDTTNTTLNWIPYNETIRIQTTDKWSGELISEQFLYPHPTRKKIQSLTIYNTGQIDEGVALIKDGAIKIQSTRTTRNSTTQVEQRIERTNDQTLQISNWSINDSERLLISEATHRVKVE